MYIDKTQKDYAEYFVVWTQKCNILLWFYTVPNFVRLIKRKLSCFANSMCALKRAFYLKTEGLNQKLNLNSHKCFERKHSPAKQNRRFEYKRFLIATHEGFLFTECAKSGSLYDNFYTYKTSHFPTLLHIFIQFSMAINYCL